MRFWESFKLALSSLRAHKLRSFLTLLGVIFGVMTVVAVAAVAFGIRGLSVMAITRFSGALRIGSQRADAT